VGILDKFRGSKVDPGDKMVLTHMRKDGQQLDRIPRETEHHLYFDTEASANAAAANAQSLGFATSVDAPGGGGSWLLNARHTILLGEATITPARKLLTDLADSLGGEYDGWDAFSDQAIASQRSN
jgi:regulator of RNase E activity RraB